MGDQARRIDGLTMIKQMLSLAEARMLTPEAIVNMTNEEANNTFKKLRWPDTDGKPVCPRCHSTEVYTLKTRCIFKCKACTKHFSMTSETIFASRKMPVRDYLLALAIFCSNAKGQNALHLSRSLDVQYRTAYSLADRMRSLARAEN